uniref:Uncharacterized protein n=1 Tax=Avena sativa TaxID=4498 RepID=A0ACD5UBV0_AVESA
MESVHDAVDISSDEEDFRRLSAGPLGWVSKLFDNVVVIDESPPQPKKMGKSAGAGEDGEGDNCVVLERDPDGPVAVAGVKRASGDAASDEVEIVAVKGQIACKDFPHSRHLCSELPFSTTSHVKHCSMCYCFVCDAPAPCKHWGRGYSTDDHCHATDKETKWKTLRKSLRFKNLKASHQRHPNVLYPTMSSPRQQGYDDDYTSEEYSSEEYTSEEEGEYFESDDEATVYVGNLPYASDSEYLAQLFKHAGTVDSSEIIYNRKTGQSRGFGFVTMSTVEQAEKAVEIFHRSELDGRLLTVNKADAPTTSRAGESRSPHRSGSSSVRIFVGNLPWDVDDSRLKRLFSEYGDVVDAEVVYRYERGGWRSRGFGFVTMARREEADDAIWDLDGQDWKGRELRVEVAKEEATRRGNY